MNAQMPPLDGGADTVRQLAHTMYEAVDRWIDAHPRHCAVMRRLRASRGDIYTITTTISDGSMRFVSTPGWPSPRVGGKL